MIEKISEITKQALTNAEQSFLNVKDTANINKDPETSFLNSSMTKEGVVNLEKQFNPENLQQQIQENSNFSPEINNFIRNPNELNIYKGLSEIDINNNKFLQKNDIDISAKDDFGMTNQERMHLGKSPIGNDGKPIELHHIGQKNDSPLAELTKTEHQNNYSMLHQPQKSEIDRNVFDNFREQYWKDRLLTLV